MDFDVERVEGGYRIFEPGQKGPGMMVTDSWLRAMGFFPLTRLNAEDVIKATFASAGGHVLNPMTRLPKDIDFKAGFRSYPSNGRGRLPRNLEEERAQQARREARQASGLVIAKR